MNVKNIKSFIEFYRFLGITSCMSQTPRSIDFQLDKHNLNQKKLDSANINSKNKKHIEMSKKDKLQKLLSEINNLECNLKETATNTVFSDGNYNSNIMFIGEAPGANEDLEGIPFVGEAGKLLDKMLYFIDLSRDNFYISNMVFWRPPGNRPPNDKEISNCLSATKKHIKIINPKLLVFVGSIAAKNLLNKKDGITKLRGKEHMYIDEINNLKIPARAIFHPAYLMRNPIEKKTTWNDLIEIDQFIKKEKILPHE